MKTKINKLSKTTAQFLLMVIALFVLILPAVTINYAENYKIQRILTVQSDYVNGFTPDMKNPINQSVFITDWGVQTVFNDTPGNYAIYSLRNEGAILTRRSVSFNTGVTYIGNHTYSVNPDFSDFVPNSSYPNSRFITVLDITSSVLAEYDFVKMSNNENLDMRIAYSTAPGSIVSFGITSEYDTGKYLATNILSSRAWLQSNPNATLYLWIGETNSFNSTYNETLTFSIEMFNLTPADSLTWDDDQIYVLTLLACDIILIVGFIFTTNFIDIQFDKTKPRTYRRKTYRRKPKR